MLEISLHFHKTQILWSTQLKAYSRLQKIPPTKSLLFIDFSSSFITLQDAATVELNSKSTLFID
jgi:hypothetical protein